MTDYSVWIYAMLAVGALITAAVVFTLSQPSDLPYLNKKK
jgi:ethanolamine transporter EutH